MIPLIERLAELEHRQWIQWAQKVIDTEPGLSPERVERWRRLIAIPYEDLSEEWKDYDREWARLVIREVILTVDDPETEVSG